MQVRGTTHVFVAFDLGFELDPTRAGSFRHKDRRAARLESILIVLFLVDLALFFLPRGHA